MRTANILFIAVLALAMVSCSSPDMTTPEPSDVTISTSRGADESRWVWGNWLMHVPEDQSSIEVVPVRTADLHFNVKMLLEQSPCDKCIWVNKFVNNGDGTISAEIKIRHPYPANPYYTGFDVRGIFHTTANYFFPLPSGPTLGFYIPALEVGDPQLLNPDGYTDAYQVNHQYWAPIFNYQPGGDLGGTFETEYPGWQPPEMPFINYYSSEVRRQFASSAVIARTYHIALPPGAWDFGYTVDACWAPPTKSPVTDIETDFPVQANSIGQPYRIDLLISGPLVGSIPSTLTIRHYWHNPGVLQYVYATGVFVPLTLKNTKVDAGQPVIVGDYMEWTLEIANELGAPPGLYPLFNNGDAMTIEGMSYLHDIEKDYARNDGMTQVLWIEVVE